MNFRKWISLIALLCFFGALVFLLQARSGRGKRESTPVTVRNLPETAPPPQQNPTPKNDPRVTRLEDGRVLLNTSVTASRELHQGTPERDLEIIVNILEQYRLFFRENPVGSENIEIIEQLLGHNSRKLVFLDPEHPALSPGGELLDRWESPYLFHPLTSTAMEILSPGPDQTLWTTDDLVLELENLKNDLQL